MLAPIFALAALASVGAAETVLGVVVFQRHGDRTSKTFSPTHLTTLGLNQVYQSGLFYRSTYVEEGAPKQIHDIAPEAAAASQVYAATPDEATLFSTGYAFLQGLYPPVTRANAAAELLANGSSVEPPLGINYLQLHSENADAPESIWLKGDVACPAYISAAKSYSQSAEFKAIATAKETFYRRFTPLLTGLFTRDEIGYGKAYEIFDYLNVGYVHNMTIRGAIDEDELFQLRTLADAHEWALAFNASQPERSIPAKTFVGKVLAQLNQTVSTKTGPKLSLLVGSYITFQSFFGLASLQNQTDDFYGLPDYASSLVFEAVTNATVAADTMPSLDDVSVRFLFRNGSAADAPLRSYPLFDKTTDLIPWNEFEERISTLQIATANRWCTQCDATQGNQPFCPATDSSEPVLAAKSDDLSTTQAGVVGAMSTLGVVAILAVIAGFLGLRVTRRRRETHSFALSRLHKPASHHSMEKSEVV
ncbi:phosphoglycerate mutase-like protein, partial [Auricularia subglabra TFB-10046 SS5]